MGDWQEFILADCIIKMNQGVNTTTEKVNYTECGIKVIRAKNILDYKIDFEDVVFINNETYNRLSINVKPKSNDVLYTNIGSQLGSAALVKIKDPFITAWNVLRIQTNLGKLSPLYLVYLLNNPNVKEDIRGYDSSSTMPFVSGKVLGAMKISLPPLPEQERIAEVLSSLDDKIDLLQRQNKTLEEMAETLFRQWFVEEAEDEWERGKISQYLNIVYGKNLPTKNLLIEGYPVFGANGKIGYYDKYSYELPQVLVSCRGEASGTVNFSEEKSFITNNSLILERKEDIKISFSYLKYFSLQTDYKIYVTGSAQPQITIESLNEAEFVLPPTDKIAKFDIFADVIEIKRKNNYSQIKQLQALRDTLLPKLMSGQVTCSI